MEKLIARAKDRWKGMAAQLESTLKDIAYYAPMAARTLSNLMRGGLNCRHRR